VVQCEGPKFETIVFYNFRDERLYQGINLPRFIVADFIIPLAHYVYQI